MCSRVWMCVLMGALALAMCVSPVASGAQDKPPRGVTVTVSDLGTKDKGTADLSEKIGESPVASGAQDEIQKGLTVAVFDFETKDKAVGDLGEKIGDLLTVFLSGKEGLQLVERNQIRKMIEEMELGASGIVAPEQATRIGGMLGAQVLITGRAFVVNEKLYITGRAISVETSRLNAQLAKGELDADLDVVVQELADKIAGWLTENADKMVAEIATPEDQVAVLKEALAGKELPVVAAVVTERHVGQATIDPAAETEVVYLMRKVGIPVISDKRLKLADWAKEFFEDANVKLPSAAQKADVVVVGEGFSEFAGRTGNLISVKARVELRVVDTKTGKILGVNRKTVTQVDLAEQIAGKTALQKAAGQAVVEMLPEAVKGWNELRKQEAKQAAKQEE